MIGSMFRKAWYSDSATLNLDFTSGVLDSRLTFTRAANTATVINGSGYVQTVNADVPRFDHDPTTLAPRGLLIEAAATNLVTYSVCSTTGWSGLNATGTNNNATAPDNNTAATLWTGGSGGNNRAYSATFSITNGTSYTLSVYVKKPSTNAARYAKIDMRSSIEGDVGWPANGVLDLDTGIASGTGFTATAMPNGWYRIVSTGTVNTTTNARAFLRITDATGSIAITSTNALLWWGAQVETGSGASSLIPTTNSQETRNADECSMTGTNFSDWFNASEGTFLARFRPLVQTAGGLANTIVSANDNTANEQIALASITNGRLVVIDGGAALANVTSGTVTLGSVARLAGAYKLNDCQSCTGGTLGTADTSVTLPTVNRLFIGRSAGATPTFLRGHIESFKFYPTRLPDATLQSLTT